MINAYSLAAETLEGTLDETYPVISKISDMKLRPQKMRLSDKTLMLLKNFSTINQSILFKKGNSLRTISVMKNILAEATIEEDIPKDFGVYDLNQFLNALSLHQKPELDFKNEGYTVISEDRARSKYFFADPNVIVSPPEKEITLPTKPIQHIDDETGEIALCILSAINIGKIRDISDFELLCDLSVRSLDELIDFQQYPVGAAEIATKARRSLGIGYIGLAHYLAKQGLSYGDPEAWKKVHDLTEAFQY